MESVEGARCCSIWDVQFERRERGVMISVPEASAGIGTEAMPLSLGFATRRLMILGLDCD